MKHIPKPWTWEKDALKGNGSDVIAITFDAEGYPIFEISEANKRLIGAAPEYDELARLIASKPAEVRSIMERHGFVIDNLDDRWQKFAFTLYTIIIEMAEKSNDIIAKVEGRA